MKPDGAGSGSVVAKMRQKGLAAGLEVIRPWRDRVAVESMLRVWARAAGIHASLANVHFWEAYDHLRRLAAANPGLPAGVAASITAGILRNLAAGRAATDYGSGWELVQSADGGTAVPRTTRRRHRNVRQWVMSSLQYDLDLAALIQRGYSESAARRWLERNRGKHAADAPPPRRPRKAA